MRTVEAEDTGAFIAILVGAMRADGREHPQEWQALVRAVETHTSTHGLHVARALEEAVRRHRSQDPAEFLEGHAAELSHEWGQRALFEVLRIAASDGSFCLREREYFVGLCTRLGMGAPGRRSGSRAV